MKLRTGSVLLHFIKETMSVDMSYSLFQDLEIIEVKRMLGMQDWVIKEYFELMSINLSANVQYNPFEKATLEGASLTKFPQTIVPNLQYLQKLSMRHTDKVSKIQSD
jgi:hypothetical protein